MENHSAKRSLLCRTIIGREVSERGASARVARRLAGRTAISLASIKRVPAGTSTSKFSTTSPSNWNTCFPRVKESLVSPMTFSGDDPSA